MSKLFLCEKDREAMVEGFFICLSFKAIIVIFSSAVHLKILISFCLDLCLKHNVAHFFQRAEASFDQTYLRDPGGTSAPSAILPVPKPSSSSNIWMIANFPGLSYRNLPNPHFSNHISITHNRQRRLRFKTAYRVRWSGDSVLEAMS